MAKSFRVVLCLCAKTRRSICGKWISAMDWASWITWKNAAWTIGWRRSRAAFCARSTRSRTPKRKRPLLSTTIFLSAPKAERLPPPHDNFPTLRFHHLSGCRCAEVRCRNCANFIRMTRFISETQQWNMIVWSPTFLNRWWNIEYWTSYIPKGKFPPCEIFFVP